MSAPEEDENFAGTYLVKDVINTCKRHNYSSWGVRQKYKPMRKYFCRDCGFYLVSHLKYYVHEAKQLKLRDREFYAYR